MQPSQLTFLHGFMGHPSDWDDVCAQLTQHSCDAPRIVPAANWSASIKQLAAAIPPSSILIGYSMGARLALGVALAFPQRCRGLVLVSGNPGLESDSDREARTRADEKIAQQIEAAIESGSLEPFLEQWYQSEVFASLPAEIRSAEIRRKQTRTPNDWPAILRANSVSRQPNFWPQLNTLSIPTLVVAGELDVKYTNVANRIEKEVTSANVTTAVVPQCGHIVHREQPQALLQIIRKFLATIPSQ